MTTKSCEKGAPTLCRTNLSVYVGHVNIYSWILVIIKCYSVERLGLGLGLVSARLMVMDTHLYIHTYIFIWSYWQQNSLIKQYKEKTPKKYVHKTQLKTQLKSIRLFYHNNFNLVSIKCFHIRCFILWSLLSVVIVTLPPYTEVATVCHWHCASVCVANSTQKALFARVDTIKIDGKNFMKLLRGRWKLHRKFRWELQLKLHNFATPALLTSVKVFSERCFTAIRAKKTQLFQLLYFDDTLKFHEIFKNSNGCLRGGR